MTMLRLLLATLCASLALAMPARADYQVQTVVEGLEHPWSLAFLPDGRTTRPPMPRPFPTITEWPPAVPDRSNYLFLSVRLAMPPMRPHYRV